jgi:hypothetical protein
MGLLFGSMLVLRVKISPRLFFINPNWNKPFSEADLEQVYIVGYPLSVGNRGIIIIIMGMGTEEWPGNWCFQYFNQYLNKHTVFLKRLLFQISQSPHMFHNTWNLSSRLFIGRTIFLTYDMPNMANYGPVYSGSPSRESLQSSGNLQDLGLVTYKTK